MYWLCALSHHLKANKILSTEKYLNIPVNGVSQSHTYPAALSVSPSFATELLLMNPIHHPCHPFRKALEKPKVHARHASLLRSRGNRTPACRCPRETDLSANRRAQKSPRKCVTPVSLPAAWGGGGVSPPLLLQDREEFKEHVRSFVRGWAKGKLVNS